jgi:hypothetical protein
VAAGFLQLVQYSTLCCQDGCYYYLKKRKRYSIKASKTVDWWSQTHLFRRSDSKVLPDVIGQPNWWGTHPRPTLLSSFISIFFRNVFLDKFIASQSKVTWRRFRRLRYILDLMMNDFKILDAQYASLSISNVNILKFFEYIQYVN